MGLFGNERNTDIDALRARKDIQGLTACLQDPNSVVRGDAAYAIGFLATKGFYDINSIQLLNLSLKDSHKNVRGNAAYALGNLAEKGAVGMDTFSLLNKLLEDPDKNVQGWAVWALSKIDESRIQEKEKLRHIEQERNNIETQEKKHKDIEMRKSLAQQYEYALNYPQAAAIYEELGLWDDARRCREISHVSPNPVGLSPPSQKVSSEEKSFTRDAALELLLDESVAIHVPMFIDCGSSDEIIVEIDNRGQHALENLSLDFSELHEFFEIEGEVRYSVLKPGIKLVNRVKITARKGIEGVIPASIGIEGNRVRVKKDYTIKVGGTEIY